MQVDEGASEACELFGGDVPEVVPKNCGFAGS